MQDLVRLLRYARPYLGKLVAALLCAAGASLVILALASLVPPLVNHILPSTTPASHDVAKKFNFLETTNR
ncbi:MAG TPA: hypothetical protein VFW45_04965, partial [Candidatus Polarisedimenticolia bacterium]|nr:hypothetical protein [Candidatus Polarisedimenticolia bacterium]